MNLDLNIGYWNIKRKRSRNGAKLNDEEQLKNISILREQIENISRGQSYKTNFSLNYIKDFLIEEKIQKSKL